MARPSSTTHVTLGSASRSERWSSACTRMRYKGLFSPQAAPTTRAYCLLFSFLVGTLMVTAGSVFLHVIQSRPMSGTHLMHTPPMSLALALVVGGILTLVSCVAVAWRYGFDDGDDSLEEDLHCLASEDVLDHQYRSTSQQHTCPATHHTCTAARHIHHSCSASHQACPASSHHTCLSSAYSSSNTKVCQPSTCHTCQAKTSTSSSDTSKEPPV